MEDTTAIEPTEDQINAAQAAAEALSTQEAVEPGVPVAIYIHQGTTLAAVVHRDYTNLAGTDCDSDALDTLAARIVWLSRADTAWQVRRAGKGDDQRGREAAATSLRDDTMADLRWFLRKYPDIQARLDDVAEGEGIADALHDLDDLALILDDHGGKIPAKAKFDPRARAAACRSTAAAARQGAAGWKASSNDDDLKKSRDKAFAYADAAVREARAAGRYAFKNEPSKLADYRDAYTLGLQRKSRKAAAAAKAVGSAVTPAG